jgi:ribosomal-protein-alanine N-acetyltransferase
MIETERLTFRKFTMDDLDWLYRMRSDEEVARYLGGPQPMDEIRERLKWYIGCYDRYGFGYCVMHLKETGEAIGWCGLQPLDHTGEVEAGYGLFREYWGRGLGTEACRAWLDHGFNQAGLQLITAIAIPENKASRHIMEKCGMKYQKQYFGRGFECALYSIAKEDFNRHDET